MNECTLIESVCILWRDIGKLSVPETFRILSTAHTTISYEEVEKACARAVDQYTGDNNRSYEEKKATEARFKAIAYQQK